MNREGKEILVNKLLSLILNDLESDGATYNGKFYDFYPVQDVRYLTSQGLVTERENKNHSFTVFQLDNNMSDEQMIEILNYCTSHMLLEKKTIGMGFDHMTLTQKGYARAMSIEKAKTYQQSPAATQNFNIGTITASNLQLGNHNTQQIFEIEKFFLNEIEKTNSSHEEKEEAKSLLSNLLENTIISGIITNISSSGITKVLGC